MSLERNLIAEMQEYIHGILSAVELLRRKMERENDSDMAEALMIHLLRGIDLIAQAEKIVPKKEGSENPNEINALR